MHLAFVMSFVLMEFQGGKGCEVLSRRGSCVFSNHYCVFNDSGFL